MISIGFTDYVDPLKLYLAKYRESVKGEKPEKKSVLKAQAKEAAAAAAAAMSSSSSSGGGGGSIYHPPQGNVYKSPNMMQQQQQQYIPPTQGIQQQSNMANHVTSSSAVGQHQLLQNLSPQSQQQPINIAYTNSPLPQYTTTTSQSNINPIQTTAVYSSAAGAVPMTTHTVVNTNNVTMTGATTYVNNTVVNTNVPLVAPPKVMTSQNTVYTTMTDDTINNTVGAVGVNNTLPLATNTNIISNASSHTTTALSQQVVTHIEQQLVPPTADPNTLPLSHPRPVDTSNHEGNTSEDGPHMKLAKKE